jgi:hypothetical protein
MAYPACSLSFDASAFYASNETNLSVNKLARAYDFVLDRTGMMKIVGTATWVNNCGGRDWLQSGDGKIGFRVYRVFGRRFGSVSGWNDSEHRLWLNDPLNDLFIRQNCPVMQEPAGTR